MSTRDYEDELEAEREYVAGLYERLDAERGRVKDRYRAALRAPIDAQNGGTLVDRDVEVRAQAREMARLNVADPGLCFGRLDSVSGERSYIGRIGLFDEENAYEPLLLDWRAPAARPFYVATAANPENMRRRRQFHTRGRQVVEFTDEVLGRPGGNERGGRGDSALLAAVSAPRGDGMRDIVATIQAEQDEIIRLDHNGVLVIEGGPGTGKTVVALHRVAYLLYTQRERIERHGVLVVGPNPAFLNYIGRVLPSLGETNVVFMTTGNLMPGLNATAEDSPDIVRLKGSRDMVGVLAAAVAEHQRLPQEPIEIGLKDVTVRINAEIAEWAIEEARASGLPHNEARAVFSEIVTYVLTERAIALVGRGWLTRKDGEAWENMRADMIAELANNDEFTAALDELWPILTPESVLAELYMSRDRLQAVGADEALWRADGEAWTVSDVPLLDELVELLGPDKPADDAAESERRAEAEYAAGVLDLLGSREDMMDDEDHLLATDMLYGEDLAERFIERDNRDLVERATSDRDWTFRHVVVDEAQELSEMDWRVLMRRCPSRSFTIVGDLAQRRSEAGARSWDMVLEPYVPGRWVYRTLSVNYRTPAEIMTVAAALLAEFAPGVQPPESVRASGARPWARRIDEDELPTAIAEFMNDEAGREGTSVVIGPADVPGAVAPSETKGLEFDAVLVVEPERILADGPRGAAELYVALTRATQRLGVLHREPLSQALAGLAQSSQGCGIVEHVFEDVGDGELIEVMGEATREESTSIAQRLAAVAELYVRRRGALSECQWWCADDCDAVAAEVLAVQNISHARAVSQVQFACNLWHRLPRLARVFVSGVIDFRLVATIINRTENVDAAVMPELDEAIGRHCQKWMKLSGPKLRDRVDQWVAKFDPAGVRMPPKPKDNRYIDIDPASPGTAGVSGYLDAADGAALDARLDALAATVCDNDPRNKEQRRAAAAGPLARLEARLACRCGLDDCPAAAERAALDAAVIHVLAEQGTVEGASNAPGYLPGFGILPAESVRELASTAKLKPVVMPSATPDPGYRPCAVTREFVKWRDLTCRWPGCDRPVDKCDLDHTVPYPAGLTHASDLKHYCRIHHLIKTFHDGWTEQQLPDGTIILNAPTGTRMYPSPTARPCFPPWPNPLAR